MPQKVFSVRVAVLVIATLLAAAHASAESRVIALTIRNGTLPTEQRLIKVRQGDDVTLRWTSDKRVTIHVHGYDIEQAITPDAAVTMRFVARASGRFPIELHGTKRGDESTLGYLEVHPR